MSRKQTLQKKVGLHQQHNTTPTFIGNHAAMALALLEDNYEVISSGFSKENFRNRDYLKILCDISGLSINDIMKKVSIPCMENMIFNTDECFQNNTPVRELHILYDVSGSMYYAPDNAYHLFHRYIAKILRKLASEGLMILIYFFSSESISMQPPITIEQFASNERIPGGTTILGPAWNQLEHVTGSVLLVTDGQFLDHISYFNSLSKINSLTLAVPTWASVSKEVIQQLRNKLGTIPLKHLPHCDTDYSIDEFACKIKYGSDVIELPLGYYRFGNIVYPECWTSPTTIANLINKMIRNYPDAIPNVFEKFIEIFTHILCNIKIDFEGCIKSNDSRNLLQIVNVFRKTSLREKNRIENEYSEIENEPSPENGPAPENPPNDYVGHFNQMYSICNQIYDNGSNQKDTIIQKFTTSYQQIYIDEINSHWDSCFSSDESGDIIDSHIGERQTHTICLKTRMPYEIIRQIRVSAHALNKETMLCLILYFTKGNFEIKPGIYTGYGTIPVWNGMIRDSIRLIPSHITFPDSDGISFTFSITVAYRIMMWLLPETVGPNSQKFR